MVLFCTAVLTARESSIEKHVLWRVSRLLFMSLTFSCPIFCPFLSPSNDSCMQTFHGRSFVATHPTRCLFNPFWVTCQSYDKAPLLAGTCRPLKISYQTHVCIGGECLSLWGELRQLGHMSRTQVWFLGFHVTNEISFQFLLKWLEVKSKSNH